MLVISRKKSEWFLIETSDGPIWIGLVGFRDDKARLGIEAPESVKVYRQELLPLDQRRKGDHAGR